MQKHLDYIKRLKRELEMLPGEAAHVDMLPLRKASSEALKTVSNCRLSAVLVLMHEIKGEPHIVLTQRNQYEGKHSGQISFPGGKIESNDPDTHFTALRETEEEIGVHRDKVEVIGQLTEVYIPVSNFLIHPYIGFASDRIDPTPDPREVSKVINCSTRALLSDENRVETKIKLDTGMVLKNVPAFNFDGHIVWGATAIILNEVKYLLKRMT
ncbi:MAG: NUDIX hydrolase [Crocinitomicaceae bacterium]